MAFSLSNITGKSYSSSGNGNITIPASTIGDIAVIITCNGNSENNTSYVPVIPGDFARIGIATNGRAVYTKQLTASDMNRVISITGVSSWGWIYFTIPAGWRLIGVLSTTASTINYNSQGKGLAIVTDIGPASDANGYALINSSYDYEYIYMKEFSAGTSFAVPLSGNNFHNNVSPHLIFQKSNRFIYDEYIYGSLGNLNFYTPYGNVTMYDGNSGYGNYQTASDVLVGKKYLYVMDCNMNMVYVYNKNLDGTFGAKYKNVNWYDQDSTINQIQRCNSSVPSAYGLFVENGQDKLVGWSMDSSVLYVWDVIDGNISNRISYKAPFAITDYSRGGWDGGSYVYFVNRGNNVLYRWDIRSKASPIPVVTLANYSSYVSYSFTGSGLFVNTFTNEVYAGSGADQTNGFLSCWDLTTGTFKGTITDAYQLGTSPLNATTGTVIINPIDRGVAYYIAMYQQSITQLRLSSLYYDRYRKKQYNFEYTGNVQVFVAPYSGTYRLECWGAEGGTSPGYAQGGKGGYAAGTISLKMGDILYIYVGQKGVDGGSGCYAAFNGGAAPHHNHQYTAGGGGGTDMRLSDSLYSRVIVAGGGGGGGAEWGSNYEYAGAGGGTNGQDAGWRNGQSGTSPGRGGSQSGAGGPAYGGFGYGGVSTTEQCGSGGGGWYGGGGQNVAPDAGGGGGSGYVVTSTSYKPSGYSVSSFYYMYDTQLIAGYSWMLTPYEGTSIGNSGNGHARITFKNMLYSNFVILIDGKYYIPTKEFFDSDKDQFIPVTLDFLKDFKNNYYKFIYDINKLNKRIYYRDFNFLPFEKLNMKNAKIVRIEYDSDDFDFDTSFLDSLYYLEDYYDYIGEPEKVVFKYNNSIDNLKDSIIKIGGLSQEYSYNNSFVDIGLKPNVKVLIKYHDKYYGTDLMETTLDRILIDGINGDELKNYKVKFLKFDIYMAFKNICYDDLDKINKINFYTKEFQNMKNIKKSDDYNMFYDKKKDNIYIKFNKDFSNILVKKLENLETESENTLEEF